MLKVAVLVSGGGTNLQAILDAIDSGKITNTEIRVVISNNEGAYALERAKNYGTEGLLLSPKSFETREEFNQKLLEALKEREIDLVVLAGYLVVVPPCVIQEYENRIINIHPSLIPSFCGKGCYGLHVHEKALERGVKERRFILSMKEPILARSLCRSRLWLNREIHRKFYSAVSWNRQNGRFYRKQSI